jgi:hypothetical protein
MSGFDMPFFAKVFEQGLLNVWDAVSVHPYRPGGPETVVDDYAKLRTLMKKYTSKDIPILCGEWGWTTCVPPCIPMQMDQANELEPQRSLLSLTDPISDDLQVLCVSVYICVCTVLHGARLLFCFLHDPWSISATPVLTDAPGELSGPTVAREQPRRHSHHHLLRLCGACSWRSTSSVCMQDSVWTACTLPLSRILSSSLILFRACKHVHAPREDREQTFDKGSQFAANHHPVLTHSLSWTRPISLTAQDDGPDAKYREQRFGTVQNNYINASVPHLPKPSYLAATTLQSHLSACDFAFRATVTAPPHTQDIQYVLAFDCPANSTPVYAVWTLGDGPGGSCSFPDQEKRDCGYYGIDESECEARGCCFEVPAPSDAPQCYHHQSPTPVNITFPDVAANMCFRVVGLDGSIAPLRPCAQADGSLSVAVTGQPIILIPSR